MAKSGQARVLTAEQKQLVMDVIKEHRHPEKNTAIMQISFKLALRAQEISLLQIKEVARLNPTGTDFELLEIMSLPAAYTKGADALNRSRSSYKRKRVSFDVGTFNQVVKQIEELAKAGREVNPENFYPPARKHRGKSRDLPMVDESLRTALFDYLRVRLAKAGKLKPSDPLFLSQKGTPYSPNTLQEHMAHILRDWAGIERASSHSGRRTVATDVIHGQGLSVKVAQKILGHSSASTTLIYEEPPEEVIGDALKNLK